MYHLELYDYAGQDEYNVRAEVARRTSDGILLVYSITSRYSLEDADDIYRLIYRERDLDPTVTMIPMVLVGNKVDTDDAGAGITTGNGERETSTEDGLAMATKWSSIPFFEVSAKSGLIVREALAELVREILRHPPPVRGKQLHQNDDRRRNCSLM